MNNAVPFWGYVKKSRAYVTLGPFADREQAIQAALDFAPKAKECRTGQGNFGPHSDIHWHRRTA